MTISDDEDNLTDDSSHNLQDDILKLPILYHCTKCSYQTPRKHSLRRHFFSCKLRPGIRNHQVVHKNDIITTGRRFKCEYCDYCSTNLDELKNHKEIHSDLIYSSLEECSKCDDTFFTVKECKKHLESIHQNPGKACVKNSTKCMYCDLVDISPWRIYNHTKQHHRMEKCATCHSIIRGLYQLMLHDFLIHKNLKVVPSWNLRCVLCSYEGDIYSCYEHITVHSKSKTTFKIMYQNHAFGFVNLNRATKKSSLPKEDQKKSKADKTIEEVLPDQSKPIRFKCSHCEFTSKFRRAIKVHTTTFHQNVELTCSICSMGIQGEFKLSCHNYLVHRENESFLQWLLKCTHCQYQGNVAEAYEHGKEHDKEMVSFRAIFDGSKRELATFRYSDEAKNLKDAILKEFLPNSNEESDVELEDTTSKSMENKEKPFQCPIKYCLFDGEKKDDMKEHLTSSHNIIKKSDLESKLQMAITTEGDHKSKPVGRRWYCFACFHESTAEETAYAHGGSHGMSTMTFLSYENHKPVSSGTFTYLTGNNCAICSYTAYSTKKLCEHNSQLHLAAYTEEVVFDDEKNTENVNEDHLCAECGHKSVTAIQMGIHQSLAHHEGKKRVFCPFEYCCFETKYPKLLKNHFLDVHEVSESDIVNQAKNCLVEVSISSQNNDDKLSRLSGENGLKRKSPETQLDSKESEVNDSWVNALESDILEEDASSDKDYSEVIRIEVVNQEEQIPQLPKNGLRIKCQNPGCTYYCLYDVNKMLEHAAKCPKKIKKEPKTPQGKRVKIDHTQPGKVSYKCWMCGVSLLCRESLNSHTYIHAKEDNNFDLRITYTVYKGETVQDTKIIKANRNFVPRSSSNYPLYIKSKQLKTPTISLEYNPNLPVFSCDQCNFKTNLQDALDKHTKLHWNAEKEAAYKSGNWFTCGVCYYHCFDSKTFKEHGETHKNRPVYNVRKVAKDSWTF